jgi:NAD(P)-dependent dehydrogenase (short-subunit alcohol dehydrogenase family)
MLSGKQVVVFGGSSGVGLGVARAVLERGAHVAIVSRSSRKLEAAAASLGDRSRVKAIGADISREADVARVFAEIGPVDHVVATAGAAPLVAPVGDLELEAVRAFFDAKLISSITLAKHASRALKPGGSITFTSGINKDRPPVPGGSVVTTIAGSFDYLARALALELAPTRVNVVSPGWVDTPMWDELVGSAKTGMWQELAKRLPAGRVGTPADIALAYVYLMESEFTTGTTLNVDGGHSLV